jgi:predicted RNA-binding Zn ribbon-like protein
MNASYSGPVRSEPLAVELHNTLYAVHGKPIDGIETRDGLGAWLSAIADRLPEQARAGSTSRLADFLALRRAVREALHATQRREPVTPEAIEPINAAAARAPISQLAVAGDRRPLHGEQRYHTADAAEIALAVIAADAIELLTGPGGEDVRACGAPGCVLMFVQDHPRRRWCSTACGNRARQARHYERTRRAK